MSSRCLQRRQIHCSKKMPSVEISKRQIQALLESDQLQTAVATPFGNVMLEIQGDLEMPSQWHEDDRFSHGEGVDLLRFGLLHINPTNGNATLFVGRKQRLLGSLVKLDTPLGMLKFDHKSGTVEMQDIFYYKVLFKSRPLPII
ncbi:CTF8 (YHR191C) [Zygosaccharomyces parabailii]|nr:CTF8 (YHR191C) [Zygosaccharomyces parabailii]